MLFQNSRFISFLFLLFPVYSDAQLLGKCVTENDQALPFANIAIQNTSTGTVSNEKGVFQFPTGSIHSGKVLICSCIGYKNISIPIAAITTDTLIIRMESTRYNLAASTVQAYYSTFDKKKTVGTVAHSGKVLLSFSKDQLGVELGKRIAVKLGKPLKIENVGFDISKLLFSSVKFRINFYSIGKDDEIDTVSINKQSIIQEIKQAGPVLIDLRSQGLIFDNDFLISIEWIAAEKPIPVSKDNELPIDFNSWVFCGPIYNRPNKEMKWQEQELPFNCGLGLYLNVRY